MVITHYIDESGVNSVILYDQNGDENYVDDISRPVDDISRPPTSIFSWPPPPEDDSRNTPTAAPLYIPPPGTQHVKPKVYTIDETQPTSTVQVENVIDMVPASWLTQQSRSAPELTTVNLREHNELTESCSESYTSTCTTTTTTSDEYQHRMYNAQSIITQSQCIYDQSSVDLNSNYDYEVASFQQNLQQYHQQQLQQQQPGSFSSASTDLISFNAGRRSVQECTDSLYNTVNTCQLVDYIRSTTPNPTENHAFVPTPRLPKKVEFADTVKAVDAESVIQSADLPSETITESNASQPDAVPITAIPPVEAEQLVSATITSSKIENPVPKEWTSLMVRALTTASPKPFQIPDVPVLADCSDCPIERKQKCTEASKPCSDVDIEECAPVQNAKDEPKAGEPAPPVENLKPWEVLESKKPPIKGFMASLLTTAPTSSVEFTKSIGEDVPMPEETVPYFPPPISMEPIERLEPRGARSPFCEALTVAPLSSFTPFEHDVITQFEDLPRTKEEIKLVDALTTAPTAPVQQLNADLPDETETERLARIEAERLEKQAAEVRKIIAETVETQMSKNISAFAAVRGFRSVDPFKPMSSASLPPTKHRSRSSSIVRTDDQTQSNACPKETAPNQNNNHNNSSVSRPSSTASTKRPVAFPPPTGLPAKSYIQSGLQSPKAIPKYQRQWFNLPSQSPIRTPEPPELKDNVPLAFVDVPHEQTDQISKPFAVTISAAAAATTSIVETKSSQQSLSSITKTTASSSLATSSEVCKSATVEPTVVPALSDKRSGPITMSFQTIDENQLNEPARSATPSLINKPAPMIPYYQQNLVAEYCPAASGHLFDPRAPSPSPRPDSAKSPAPGPPPNPMKIQAPRIKPLDAADPHVWVPSIVTGESAQKCQINSLQSQENAQLLSETKKGMQIATQSFMSTPQSITREQRGDQTTETRSQSSQLNQAQKSNLESSSTVQIGDTQIQRNRRVVEEYEHTQKASTVEIYKSSDGQQRTISQTQNAQAIQQNAYGKGFVARTARRLSETPQNAKNTIVSYHFPHIKSPVTVSGFPVKTPPLVTADSFDVIQKESFPPPLISPLPTKLQCSRANATANSQCTNQLNQCASSDSCCSIRPIIQTTSNSIYKNVAKPVIIPVDKPQPTLASNVASAAINTLSAFNPIANNNNRNTVVSDPSHASAGPNKGTSTKVSATTAPKRGRGVLNKSVGPGARVPQCGSCNAQIR